MTKNKMRPVHPGEILQEQITELNISANFLAKHLKVPTNRITQILNKQRKITPDTALRLAKAFNTSPEFWLNLQVKHDIRKAELSLSKKELAAIKHYKQKI